MKRILILCCCFTAVFQARAQLTLDECRRLAREHYPEIRQYDLIRQTAEYTLSNARRAYLPRFGLSAQATWQTAVPDFPDALTDMLARQGVDFPGMDKDQYKLQLEMEQTIWDGGQSSADKRIAEAEAAEQRRSADVDFHTLQGRVDDLYFGILLLTTLLVPDAGFAAVDGFDTVRDYRRIRERVGYMPGRFSLYPDLSVGENLAFFAALFGVEIRDNYELIAPIYSQIEPFRTRRAGKLSGGMKQKLALCCALVHRPSVLLLDEPTTGVDAVSRSEFWDMLSELKRRGISILVSTPYMDEARRCDRIALCNEGRVLGIDTPQGIVGTYGDPLYALSGDDMYGLLVRARRAPGVRECYPFGEVHHLVATREFDSGRFARELGAEGFGHVQIQPAEAGIEDVFIKLMHHE